MPSSASTLRLQRGVAMPIDTDVATISGVVVAIGAAFAGMVTWLNSQTDRAKKEISAQYDVRINELESKVQRMEETIGVMRDGQIEATGHIVSAISLISPGMDVKQTADVKVRLSKAVEALHHA